LIFRGLWFKKREGIDRLLEIDRIDPDKLESINFIIYAFFEGMRPQKNRYMRLVQG